MKPIFVLIRGNSGSGKSALASKLQNYFGYQKSLLLHEDLLRLEILHVKENKDAPTIEWIRTMVKLGMQSYPVIILEGILPKSIYGEMLNDLRQEFGNHAFAYYLDVPFDQTLINNSQKEHSFSRQELEKWHLDDDYLDEDERCLKNEQLDDSLEQILSDLAQI